jgi:hypothetical protein
MPVPPNPTAKYPEAGPLISTSTESVLVFRVTSKVIVDPKEVDPWYICACKVIPSKMHKLR